MDRLVVTTLTQKIYMTGDQRKKRTTKKLIDYMMKEMIKGLKR
jgi:hypothetical protein